MSNDFPAQITQTLYLQASEHAPTDLRLSCTDMSRYGDLPYGTVEVTVDVPRDLPDPVALRITALEAKRAAVQQSAFTATKQIDDEIQRLRAITHEPSTAASA